MRLFIAVAILLGVNAAALAGWDEGVAAFKKKDFQTAATEFQAVVDQNPDAYSGHYMLGLSLRQLNRKEESLNHLRKAYDLNPNDLSIKIELGRAYVDVRRYPDAARLLGTVSASDIDRLDARRKGPFYKIRALARDKSNDEDGAFADYRTLAGLYPEDAQLQHKYGVLAANNNLMSEALIALERASGADPGDQHIKRSYVIVLKKQGRVQRDKNAKKQTYLKAAGLARELVGLDGSYDNLLLRCEVELGASLYPESVSSCGQAAAMKPNDWLAKYYLGQGLASNQQYEDAEAPLNQASRLASASDQSTVWRQLGFVFEKQKKYLQSIEAYEKAGDNAAVARVRQNKETARENARIEAENKQIEQMREEAEELERRLKELEDRDGGRS